MKIENGKRKTGSFLCGRTGEEDDVCVIIF